MFSSLSKYVASPTHWMAKKTLIHCAKELDQMKIAYGLEEHTETDESGDPFSSSDDSDTDSDSETDDCVFSNQYFTALLNVLLYYELTSETNVSVDELNCLNMFFSFVTFLERPVNVSRQGTSSPPTSSLCTRCPVTTPVIRPLCFEK